MTGEEMGGWVRRKRREIGERGVEVLKEKTGEGCKGETERQTGRGRRRGMGRVEQNAVKEEEEMEDGWREEADKM